MTVESWTGGGPFRFTVSAANGTQLGSGSQGQSWSGTLPSTGDYQITLQSPADAPATTYGLLITIVTTAPAPTPVPPPPAQRIQFPPGFTSTTVWGYVDSATPVRYVLRALAGQSMSVNLTTQHNYPASVTIRNQQGAVMGAANAGVNWSGYLPATQDYYLDVQVPAGSPGDNYSLWVGIR
jgi:hypothetical protein